MAITDAELKKIDKRARELIRMDKEYHWRETINIVNYSVFEDGVNLIPKLVAEIRRLNRANNEAAEFKDSLAYQEWQKGQPAIPFPADQDDVA